MSVTTSPAPHYDPKDFSDRLAYAFTKFIRFFADVFFASRYGHRAVVLETVAAVPGMVGGALQHLRALRRMESDGGWIRTLLEEAENERMHLMTFIQIAQPSLFERLLVLLAQGVFYNLFFFFTCSLRRPRIASSVTSRKKRSTATRNIWLASTTAPMPTWRPLRSPLNTGSSRPTHGYVTSSLRSALTRLIIAMSIINLPTRWLDPSRSIRIHRQP